MTPLRIATLALLVTVLSPVRAGDMAASAVEKAIDAAFSDIERQVIESYYGKQPATEDETDEESKDDKGDAGKHDGKDKKGKSGNKKAPPGLAKKDQLPPGLAKRDTLPPGLAKRNLPADLEGKLPPVPEGYERRIVMDEDQAVMVLVHKASNTVADVIKDVLIPRD